MLVRLKKRGEFPNHSVSGNLMYAGGVRVSELFRGCCVEVIPFVGIDTWSCDGQKFKIADARMLALLPEPAEGRVHILCSHYLIDDLNAYDSDSADEQAEIGDLAFADVAVPAVVKL